MNGCAGVCRISTGTNYSEQHFCQRKHLPPVSTRYNGINALELVSTRIGKCIEFVLEITPCFK